MKKLWQTFQDKAVADEVLAWLDWVDATLIDDEV